MKKIILHYNFCNLYYSAHCRTCDFYIIAYGISTQADMIFNNNNNNNNKNSLTNYIALFFLYYFIWLCTLIVAHRWPVHHRVRRGQPRELRRSETPSRSNHPGQAGSAVNACCRRAPRKWKPVYVEAQQAVRANGHRGQQGWWLDYRS